MENSTVNKLKHNISKDFDANQNEFEDVKIDKITNIVPEDGGWLYSNLNLETGDVEVDY